MNQVMDVPLLKWLDGLNDEVDIPVTNAEKDSDEEDDEESVIIVDFSTNEGELDDNSLANGMEASSVQDTESQNTSNIRTMQDGVQNEAAIELPYIESDSNDEESLILVIDDESIHGSGDRQGKALLHDDGERVNISSSEKDRVRKRFICECGRSFSFQSHLKVHKRIHTEEKPFECEKCGKTFKQKGALIFHKRTHSGEKPYECDICSKSFAHKQNLNVHNRIHTGEKPFKCASCKKPFSTKQNLISHKRTHTGEKPFKCDECGRYFAHARTLITHKKIHSR